MHTSHFKNDQVFHPVEHAVISRWLGVEPPDHAKDIDIFSENIRLPNGVVRIERDHYGRFTELSVLNAVARIILSTVMHSLPVWIEFIGNARLFGREDFNKHYGSVNVLPQLLFEVNWHTHAEGIPYPAAYYIGFLPYYEVYVVTLSIGSAQPHGYLDLAIGYFDAHEDMLEGSLRLVQANWEGLYNEHAQPCWEDVSRTGLISQGQIEHAAESVWG